MLIRNPIGRFLLILPVIAMLCAAASGQQPRRERIDAAIDHAVAALRSEIGRQPLGPESSITVDDFLQATGREKTLFDLLRKGEQIGGPRWIDDDTCQVRLEISGSRVADTLIQIATSARNRSPVDPAVLARQLAPWRQRRFAATGTSAGDRSAELIHAAIVPAAWKGVDDEARRAAILAARDDARRRLLASLRSIPLDGHQVGMLLDEPKVAERVAEYIDSRPIERVDFTDDQRVEVRLAVRPGDVIEIVRNTAETIPPEVGEEQWQAAREEIRRRLGDVCGSARADEPAAPATARAGVRAGEPDERWLDEPIEVEATAPSEGSKLRTARAAERQARQQLLERLMQLKLRDGRPLGEWARGDERVMRAVQRAAEGAGIYRAEYRSDGAASVRILLDLYNLYAELQDLHSSSH
jgi:hypothetical protein